LPASDLDVHVGNSGVGENVKYGGGVLCQIRFFGATGAINS
jgi:hypothetical protein